MGEKFYPEKKKKKNVHAKVHTKKRLINRKFIPIPVKYESHIKFLD